MLHNHANEPNRLADAPNIDIQPSLGYSVAQGAAQKSFVVPPPCIVSYGEAQPEKSKDENGRPAKVGGVRWRKSRDARTGLFDDSSAAHGNHPREAFWQQLHSKLVRILEKGLEPTDRPGSSAAVEPRPMPLSAAPQTSRAMPPVTCSRTIPASQRSKLRSKRDCER